MNSEDFSGKSILVTGAARGLGLKIAAAFHSRGGMLMLNDLDAPRIDQAIAGLGGGDRLAPAAADISTVAGCENIVDASLKRFGRLDVVVNNAAINWEMPIEAHTEEIWDKHLDTILKGSFFITRAAIPALKSSKGSVVNIASELGLRPIINNVAYCAAKGGLVNMTRALAVELAPAIRVNCVCPGSMDTELMRECADASGDAKSYYAYYEKFAALNRIGTPAEVAETVLFVASDRAAFMTGSIITVDGGSTAGRHG
jgi:NAD(P)-dependent dehydrogenase (short-subunit alcohol dehydrogenase family)